jgi:hypothetical protein
VGNGANTEGASEHMQRARTTPAAAPGFAEVLPVERAGAKNDSRKWPGSGPPNYRAGIWSDPSDSRPVACSTGILLNGLPKDLAVELTQRPRAFLSGPHNHVGRNK